MATAANPASPTRRWPSPTPRQKRLTLIACISGSAVVFIDSTAVNVALPAIRQDLGAGLAAQQWVVEGYLLTLASLILIGGSLSDLFDGRLPRGRAWPRDRHVDGLGQPEPAAV